MTDFKKLVDEHTRINRDLYAEGEEDGLPDNLDAAVRIHAKRVFRKYGENLSAAKDALGISVNTLKKYLG